MGTAVTNSLGARYVKHASREDTINQPQPLSFPPPHTFVHDDELGGLFQRILNRALELGSRLPLLAGPGLESDCCVEQFKLRRAKVRRVWQSRLCFGDKDSIFYWLRAVCIRLGGCKQKKT